MRLHKFVLLSCLTILPIFAAGCAHETPAEHAANTYAAQELAAAPELGNLPDYSLPADKLAKAQHLDHIHTTLFFANTLWGIAQLLLLLFLGTVAWIRDRAADAGSHLVLQRLIFPLQVLGMAGLYAMVPILIASVAFGMKHVSVSAVLYLLGVLLAVWHWRTLRKTTSQWVQGYSFSTLFTLSGLLLDLPVSLYEQHVRRSYGLSVQSWASWFGDLGKSFALEVIFGGLFIMLLFWLIRRFPRGWWVFGWAAASVFMLVGIFASPYVIDPLFNKFEPLGKTQPELVTRLEEVVAKGHMNIPPERMFLMKASAKVTTLNAYVTGFGASKRVVVWDTSLAKGTPDEVLFIFGHESGHYVLHHIVIGIFLGILGFLVSFALGYVFVRWAVARFGPRWRIPSQEDWGALAVLMLAFTLLSTVAQPVGNLTSRSDEHAADVYGQEAIHGLVANPQETARAAFAVLGENSFVPPNPNQFMEFWTGNHPSIGRRAAFAHAYDPWAPGVEPKYFPKQ